MACTCAPCLLQARSELNDVYPLRDKSSDGCCGDADHATRKSDHNPNLEGYATAYDYDEDVVEGMGDQELTGMALVLLDDKRTKYLIYEAQLLYPDGTVRPYTGINAHKHHLHHSIHDWAVMDKRPWGIARAFQQPAPAPPEEDEKMLYLFRHKDHAEVWLTDLVTKRHVHDPIAKSTDPDYDKRQADALVNVQYWARKGKVWNNAEVVVVDDAGFLDSIPTVS